MSAVQTAQIVTFPTANMSVVDAFIAGLPSQATRQVYRQVLHAFGSFVGGGDLMAVSRRDVEAYRSQLEQLGRAPATVAKHLAVLSGLFRYALDDGIVTRNPVASARRPKVPDVSPRRALSQAEVQSLLAVPDITAPVGLRDRALLTCLACQGWRISEALSLRVEDLAEDGGHRVATIVGKGNKVVRVTLAGPTSEALQAWMTCAEITSGPIFIAVAKGGAAVHGDALSQQGTWKRLQIIAQKAGIKRHLHAHLFRHTAVTIALDSGVPLHQVTDFARHNDPRTTRRYDSHRNSLNNPACHVLAARLIPHR